MELKKADAAWGAIVAGVVAYDVFCPKGETLSERVDDYMETRPGKLAAYSIIGATALHLCNILPDKYDPIHLLASRRKRNK